MMTSWFNENFFNIFEENCFWNPLNITIVMWLYELRSHLLRFRVLFRDVQKQRRRANNTTRPWWRVTRAGTGTWISSTHNRRVSCIDSVYHRQNRHPSTFLFLFFENQLVIWIVNIKKIKIQIYFYILLKLLYINRFACKHCIVISRQRQQHSTVQQYWPLWPNGSACGYIAK